MKRIMNTHHVLLAAGIAVMGSAAEGATLSGTVTAQGKPLAGALVTLWNQERNRKQTVYTDDAGKYVLNSEFVGKTQLRGRATNWKDSNREIVLAPDTVSRVDLDLPRPVTPEEISEALTASAHNGQLPFPDDATKKTFINQCGYCHQQGNSLTRQPHTKEGWNATAWRMEGYGAYITYGEHKRIVDTLSKGFTGKPVVVQQESRYSPELATARVEEWITGDALSFLHDTFVGADGKLYGIDEGHDQFYILDRKTSAIEVIDMPVTDEVVGGAFRGLQLPLGIFTGRHGPHSAAQIKDGRMFITGALSAKLIMFNPATREWKLYKLPRGFLWRKGLYPHTIRTDKEDKIWFTVMASNMVVKFDPVTETFTEVMLPHNGTMRWITDTFLGVILKIADFFPEKNTHLALSHHKWMNGGRGVLNWPYGIDVNPKDGGIWYSNLLADKIGHVDPKTLAVTQYDTPAIGPRRMRFGADGILWIPSFDEGKLMRFDPVTKLFETITLPLLGKNEYELPYALNVHPRTGDVWIAANNSDRVLRYLPTEKRFIEYKMPSRVVWFRDFDFTEDGKVCTSNSNLPAYAHEDGLPAFVCIDPDAPKSAAPKGRS